MYNHPSQFTPLIPSEPIFNQLVDEAKEIVTQSHRLTRAAHPSSLSRIRDLVRSMNAYYSNLIEEQSTHPANINRALRKDFSDNPVVASQKAADCTGSYRGRKGRGSDFICQSPSVLC